MRSRRLLEEFEEWKGKKKMKLLERGELNWRNQREGERKRRVW
jgi:hypothetical protein